MQHSWKSSFSFDYLVKQYIIPWLLLTEFSTPLLLIDVAAPVWGDVVLELGL